MQLVFHLCNKVKEYSPTLDYIEVLHVILAYNLSQLHCLVTPTQITEGKSLVEPAEVSNNDNAQLSQQRFPMMTMAILLGPRVLRSR